MYSYIYYFLLGVKKQDTEKQKTFQKTKARIDEKMRKLTNLESGLLIIIVALSFGSSFTIMENQTNKIYLHISLQENRNYLQILLHYNPDNSQLKKELNNTQSEIKSLESGQSLAPIVKIAFIFGALVITFYIILPVIPRKSKEIKKDG